MVAAPSTFEGFTHFGSIQAYISKTDPDPNLPLHLLKISKEGVDTVEIRQNSILIATFSPNYEYTGGLVEVLEDNHYRFNLGFDIETFRCSITISVYVDSVYLNSLHRLPVLLSTICRNSSTFPVTKRPGGNKIESLGQWMHNLETSPLTIQSKVISTNYHINWLQSTGKLIACHRDTHSVVNIDTLPSKLAVLRGGIVFDSTEETRMNATRNIISLNEPRPTLIVCPRRVCNSWKRILSSTNRVALLTSSTQYRKWSPSQGRHNVVVVSYNLLQSPIYLQTCKLERIKWTRIVLDDALDSKPDIERVLHSISTDYAWICGPEPYTEWNQYWETMSFLAGTGRNTIGHTYHLHQPDAIGFLKKCTYLIQQDTSSNSGVRATTEILEPTDLERKLYQEARGDRERMRRVLVSSPQRQILGKDAKSVADIQMTMREYYKHQLGQSLGTRDKSLHKIRLKLFDTLANRLGGEGTCPICLEELREKSVTVIGCGHLVCTSCMCHLLGQTKSARRCPICRYQVALPKTSGACLGVHPIIPKVKIANTNRIGTKMTHLVQHISDRPRTRCVIYTDRPDEIRHIAEVLQGEGIQYLQLEGSSFTITCRIARLRLDTSIRVVLVSNSSHLKSITFTDMIIFDECTELLRSLDNRIQVTRLLVRNTLEHDYYRSRRSVSV